MYSCPNCQSENIIIDESPFYGIQLQCRSCGNSGILVDEVKKKRQKIIKGLVKTVEAKVKRWGH